MMNPERIRLFYDNHCYETEIIDFYIFPDWAVLKEETYEHGDGGAYGLKYVLDPANFQKFIVLMESGGRDCRDTITDLFSGADGAKKFTAYCTEHQLEYVMYC